MTQLMDLETQGHEVFSGVFTMVACGSGLQGGVDHDAHVEEWRCMSVSVHASTICADAQGGCVLVLMSQVGR